MLGYVERGRPKMNWMNEQRHVTAADDRFLKKNSLWCNQPSYQTDCAVPKGCKRYFSWIMTQQPIVHLL